MNDFRTTFRNRLHSQAEDDGTASTHREPVHIPLTLVGNAGGADQTTGDSQEAMAHASGGVEPQDLPTSPPLTTPELGDAPVLALDAEANAGDIQVTQPPVYLLKQDEEKAAVPMNLRGNTVIPKGWAFKGEVTGPENMTFECNLNGNVECTGPNSFVAFGQDCKSQGTVVGKKILLKGEHTGVVNGAGGQVVVESTSKISGELTYTTIQMNGGVHNFQLKYVPAGTADAEIQQ